MPEDKTSASQSLRSRLPEGGTQILERWGLDSEYGVLRDVLLGPVETFGHMDNTAVSSIYRETARVGRAWDHQTAVRQYREMCDAYKEAGARIHTLPADEHLKYGVYARDSSFMMPWAAVITQMANPRRRGENSTALRFYLEAGIPIYDMVSAGRFEGGDFHIIEPGAVLIGYTGMRCEEVSARQHGKNRVSNRFAGEGHAGHHADKDRGLDEPAVARWRYPGSAAQNTRHASAAHPPSRHAHV